MAGVSISEASGQVNGSSSALSQKRQRSLVSPGGDGAKKRSLMLMDSDLLDCPICYEPLTVPIFQCDNGHLACSSCCPKLSNHCPSCASPIGDKRCRAMENVLESTFVPCQNAELGCTKNVSYGKESTHKRECNFSPCSCPVQDCNFIGTYKDLYVHYRITHSKNYLLDRFTCGVSFSTQLNIKNETVILRENSKYLLFTMHCFRKPYGVIVTISCIAPSAPEVGEFSYHLSYTVDGHTLTYESSKVKRVLEVSCQTGQENFMLIPHCLLRGDLLKMELCIRSRRSITEQEG
ncbi:E3 ubiquitin-protein ligase SINA-like 7 [Raphanus sativus]|uniref:RING-type E3 ubiquitin transferase n=1 Tax=Raphanus sativus TaxID=3726 RepID=A0A6J0N964_RAPSA|nr:E3 ubiquitin-protein ligase SINA-like 7 [Raphanus sativus]KAJ4917603.1 E3 ubiquitin-protein ligase SINA-like 7 [Raphanus sativus]